MTRSTPSWKDCQTRSPCRACSPKRAKPPDNDRGTPRLTGGAAIALSRVRPAGPAADRDHDGRPLRDALPVLVIFAGEGGHGGLPGRSVLVHDGCAVPADPPEPGPVLVVLIDEDA